jgi:hypothetical protein
MKTMSYVCSTLLVCNSGQLERADKTSRVLDAKYHHLLESPKQVGSLDLIQQGSTFKVGKCVRYV